METHFQNLAQGQGAMARERVLQDLKTLARDSEVLLKSTAGDLGERAGEARRRLAGALERAKAAGAELKELTVASAKVTVNKADIVIRDHPYESIGIAFGIGVLVGVLVSRR
jgi:ElaB/YqjD/DUF883 family membrane-anchored ribosome-binding protein